MKADTYNPALVAVNLQVKKSQAIQIENGLSTAALNVYFSVSTSRGYADQHDK